ncbi:FimB/Mfa2 family fimbrial subunit [Parabacteroides sp. PF5-6]|uniref:FimB/Mfa2 family fimbrial subunit n=1 Tax=Parabacteroides sp. PF5-6 TaxID=1742403 RepID=UPI002406353D|nr:FimB/Mfa2 family fimbrial subunit [Parabacteroides sp. PF5-6]MDF9831542.1 hypothetical protein [Parabacteroides sp. PF5-6]
MRRDLISYSLKFPTLLLFCCLVLSGCGKSDKEDGLSFSFQVKVLNLQGKDITPACEVEEIRLYFFDENDKLFDKQILDESSITQEFLHAYVYEGVNRTTIVAWGNTAGNKAVSLVEPEMGAPLSDLYLQLTFASHPIYSSPMIYYGKQTITAGKLSPIVIEMKLLLGDLKVGFYADAGEGENYTCQVSGLYDRINNDGEPDGEAFNCTLPLHYSSGKWESEKVYLPSGQIKVDLYQDDELIRSMSEDTDTGRPFMIETGHETIIVFP